jgi:hypothetical protein
MSSCPELPLSITSLPAAAAAGRLSGFTYFASFLLLSPDLLLLLLLLLQVLLQALLPADLALSLLQAAYCPPCPEG